MKQFVKFTLVELLIVIAIIAILASLLLPALRKARGKAKEIKCASNIKEITLATMSYANDHAGWGPYHPDGGNYLFNMTTLTPFPEYIGTPVAYTQNGTEPQRRQAPPLTICPEGGRDGTRNLSWNLTATPMPNVSYGYRGSNATSPLENIFKIYNPSTRFLLADSLTYIFYIWKADNFAYRHNGALNVSFTDGYKKNSSRPSPFLLG
jgi:prepilin-type N-terminal cleavage/methylation domain-containing protein/prepilin-type processing-associated H-X9-DG protein